MPTLRLGTRGSALAMAQSSQFAEALSACTGVVVETVLVKTLGDAHQTSADAPPPGIHAGVGIFTKALEDALLDGRIDFAVHSLKDLPCILDERFALAAVPTRADHRDALCARDGLTLAGLPAGACVGTGSPRRRAFIKRLRPDLELVPIRGNIGTRLGKVGTELDAVVLAYSGLCRGSLEGAVTELLGILPAPGQGALGLECRADDQEALAILQQMDDANSRLTAGAERSLHLSLGGGCYAPIAALASCEGGELRLHAAVAALDGSAMVEGKVSGPPSQVERLVQTLSQELCGAGALEILADARESIGG